MRQYRGPITLHSMPYRLCLLRREGLSPGTREWKLPSIVTWCGQENGRWNWARPSRHWRAFARRRTTGWRLTPPQHRPRKRSRWPTRSSERSGQAARSRFRETGDESGGRVLERLFARTRRDRTRGPISRCLCDAPDARANDAAPIPARLAGRSRCQSGSSGPPRGSKSASGQPSHRGVLRQCSLPTWTRSAWYSLNSCGSGGSPLSK